MSNNAPTHAVFVVVGTEAKRRWIEIGAAWPHKDAQGFNITLDALPPSGRLVLRASGQNPEQGGPQ